MTERRQEPGDPRAKAIEAAMESLRVGRSEKALLRDFLAALEAEGWGLTCTREGERGGATISEIPVEGDGNA